MVRKKSARAAASAASIQEALTALRNNEYKSVYAAAQALKVSETTLRAQWKQTRLTRVEANEAKQLLSGAEEAALAGYVKELSRNGYPPTYATVQEMAAEIQRRRVAKLNFEEGMELVQYPPIGEDWPRRFIERHPNLTAMYSRRIDASRLKEASAETITRWLESAREVIQECNIRSKNIYNMDETGFAIGSIKRRRIITDRRMHQKFQAQPGRQEWVTAIECICGDGSTVNPLIIFKGENVMSDWILPAKKHLKRMWKFSASARGWTSDLHGLEWLRRCFEPETREKANGEWRLLILDGHGSHVTGSFLVYCLINKIHVLRIPPHTSHLTQPLDVGLFGPLKTALSVALDPLLRKEVSRLHKSEWLTGYIEARENTFSKDNVFGGWRGAGLIPHDRQKVLRHLPPPPSSPRQLQTHETPSQPTQIFESSFITSSPPDAVELRTTTQVLHKRLAEPTPLLTPERNFLCHLSRTTERLRAENSILQQENFELKRLNALRQERGRGVRVALKDRLLLTADDLQDTVYEMRRAEGEKRKSKPPRKKRKSATPPPPTSDSIDRLLDQLEAEDSLSNSESK